MIVKTFQNKFIRHNANKGCRTCTIKKGSLSDYNQDIAAISRYHHITDGEILKIFREPVRSRKDQLCTEYGLRLLPSILDKLKRDRHLQTPQDIYHATAGKIGRLLKLTCGLFSQEGEREFIKNWKSFERPKNWSRLPNPISHHSSFMMSDYLRLTMIMPFILNNFLKVTSLKPERNISQHKIISCWVCVAKTMKMVFENKFTLDSYNKLQECLREEMIILTEVRYYYYVILFIYCHRLLTTFLLTRLSLNLLTYRTYILTSTC